MSLCYFAKSLITLTFRMGRIETLLKSYPQTHTIRVLMTTTEDCQPLNEIKRMVLYRFPLIHQCSKQFDGKLIL